MNRLSSAECKAAAFIYLICYTSVCGFLIFPLLETCLRPEGYHAARLLITLLLAAAMALVCGRWLATDFSDFLNSLKQNILRAFAAAAALLMIQFLFSALLNLIPVEFTPVNQLNNISMLRSDPFGFLILACIAGPFMEEIMFRAVIASVLPERISASAGSLLFAAMHMIASLPYISAAFILYFAEYALIGWILAKLYEYKNILMPSILAHSFMNLAVFVILNSI